MQCKVVTDYVIFNREIRCFIHWISAISSQVWCAHWKYSVTITNLTFRCVLYTAYNLWNIHELKPKKCKKKKSLFVALNMEFISLVRQVIFSKWIFLIMPKRYHSFALLNPNSIFIIKTTNIIFIIFKSKLIFISSVYLRLHFVLEICIFVDAVNT